MSIEERRERVFFVLAGIFISAMAMLNVIGITRFIQVGPFSLPVGVLPYPITFLCTDIISELYGKSRASFVVWLGFACNLLVFSLMWIGGALPAVTEGVPPWQTLSLGGSELVLSSGEQVTGQIELYRIIYTCTLSSVWASMLAYLAAQFTDVHLFHFWKKLTQGRHLWLRNNGSTMISQLVDTAAVSSITFGPAVFSGAMSFDAALTFFWGSYSFKLVAALIDTPIFYLAISRLKLFLQL